MLDRPISLVIVRTLLKQCRFGWWLNAADGLQSRPEEEYDLVRDSSSTEHATMLMPASRHVQVAKVKSPVDPITEQEACQLIRAHRFNRSVSSYCVIKLKFLNTG